MGNDVNELSTSDRIIDMVRDMTAEEINLILVRIEKERKRKMREQLKLGDTNPPPKLF